MNVNGLKGDIRHTYLFIIITSSVHHIIHKYIQYLDKLETLLGYTKDDDINGKMCVPCFTECLTPFLLIH